MKKIASESNADEIEGLKRKLRMFEKQVDDKEDERKTSVEK